MKTVFFGGGGLRSGGLENKSYGKERSKREVVVVGDGVRRPARKVKKEKESESTLPPFSHFCFLFIPSLAASPFFSLLVFLNGCLPTHLFSLLSLFFNAGNVSAPHCVSGEERSILSPALLQREGRAGGVRRSGSGEWCSVSV